MIILFRFQKAEKVFRPIFKFYVQNVMEENLQNSLWIQTHKIIIRREVDSSPVTQTIKISLFIADRQKIQVERLGFFVFVSASADTKTMLRSVQTEG